MVIHVSTIWTILNLNAPGTHQLTMFSYILRRAFALRCVAVSESSASLIIITSEAAVDDDGARHVLSCVCLHANTHRQTCGHVHARTAADARRPNTNNTPHTVANAADAQSFSQPQPPPPLVKQSDIMWRTPARSHVRAPSTERFWLVRVTIVISVI